MSVRNSDPSSTVIVPLNVEAMWVAPGDVGQLELAGAYGDFSKLNGSNYREDQISSLQKRKAESSDVGVHLQWTLPPPLNLGLAQDTRLQKDGDVKFPPAPNRWVVYRISEELGIPNRAWVVESDFCALDGNGGASVPMQLGGRRGHARLGRCVPLEDWTESPRSDSCAEVLSWPLTAVGWGDPAFAAYYPSCPNVFGFHDALEGISNPDNRVVTYTVAGWHSRPEDDLLVSKDIPRDALPWQMDEQSDAENFRKAQTSLYHGSVLRIRYSPVKPEATDAHFAVGNNPEEAFSAFFRPAESPAQRELNAVLTGVNQSLPSIDRRDSHVDEELHALRFKTREAGRLWAIRCKPDSQRPGDRAEKVDDELVLPPALVTALAEYNDAQRAMDYATRLWTARRRRLRDDLLLIEQTTEEENSSLHEQLRKRFDRDLTASFTTDLEATEGRLSVAKSLTEELCKISSTAERELEVYSIPAPRFWQPRDPVIVIGHGGDRLAPRIDPSGKITCTLGSSARSKFADFCKRSLFFSDGRIREALCRAPKEFYPGGSERYFEEFKRLPFFDLLPALFAWEICRHYDFTNFHGQMPNKTFRPVYLQWKGNYQSVETDPNSTGSYSSDWLAKTWNLQVNPRDHAELGATLTEDQLRTIAPEAIKVHGATMVDHKTMDACIKRLEVDGDRWKAIRNDGRPLVSASLSGLHDHLMGYRSVIALPGRDRRSMPLPKLPSWLEDSQSGDDLRPNILDKAFMPLRAGGLEVKSLELIDTFGRIRNVDPAPANDPAASSLTPPHELRAKLGKHSVLLPPRILVSSRLAFRLRSSPTEADDRVSSPVHGWVIPSLLEKGFIFCAPDGTMAGILRDAPDPDGTPRFMPAPGRRQTNLQGPCRRLLEALVDKKLTTRTFRSSIEKEVNGIVPEERQHRAGPGQLMGRPLAIVETELGVDLEGDLPPRKQSAFDNEDDGAFSSVKVSVLLGDPKRLNDGLAGFFLTKSNGTEFEFSKWFTAGTNITLPGLGRHQRIRVLMLIDPQAPVHATTGLFPVKSMALPTAYFRKARENLGVLFPCGPLLLPHPTEWTLPLAPVEDQQWHWTARGENGWQQIPEASTLPVAAEPPEASHLKSRIWLTLRPAVKKT